ncbi:Brain-specific angiogenesis inhibitor 1-associated protein 2-like protein 1 [Liparis tanakae]|uniref:Brain-specific angiogenesis inhibitor 1-associated protein 2-like protein 1 n=1 Tax=Liparis tanakae TaxID=230148 RepID=A0A4Z2HUE1_9TELE|nr:Brain-specific angiogenesis inhibitor 1-associated protein 2-like protein 1 [Liparis tanakae]
MSRSVDEVNKLTESTYKRNLTNELKDHEWMDSVMDQFNPGLRNLVNLGKNYEKAVAAMILAGKLYFDAMSKIGENAAVSPVSRELDDAEQRAIKDTLQTNKAGRVMHRNQSLQHAWQTF